MHYFVPFLVLQSSSLAALLLLSYGCLVTVNVLWLFHRLPRVGLKCVIVVFPDHTHLLFIYTSILFLIYFPIIPWTQNSEQVQSIYRFTNTFISIPISHNHVSLAYTSKE